jgi:hypothetical protein
MKSAFGIEHEISKRKLFDQEARRHARQPYYVGGLAGTSAAAGAGSLVALKRPKSTHVETDYVKGPKGQFTGRKYMRAVTTKGPRSYKAAAGLAAVAGASAGGAALIARHARKGGKTYTNQYET